MDLRPRIVVMGGGEAARHEVASMLERGGFSDVTCCADVPASLESRAPGDSGDGAGDDLERGHGEPGGAPGVPDLLVVVGDMAACARARAVPALEDVPILAVPEPGDPGDSTAALAAEADDVAKPPLDVPVLATRARRLIAMAQTRRKAQLVEYLQDAMLSIQTLSASDDDSPEELRQALLLVAEAMQYQRASLIVHIDGSDTAYVIAATDDPSLFQFVLDLDDYPELRAALERGKPVLIADSQSDPLTEPVAATLADKGVRGIAVFPVMWKGSPLGAVLLRSSRPGIEHLDKHRLAFGLLFAKHAAARLQHGKVVDSLRDQTQRISRTRYEAHRRLRTIDSLKEHFEAAADGVMALEQDGRILFVNRTAERITGFARDGLVGADMGVLMAETQGELIRQVVSQVLQGENVDAFDLDLHTTSGELLCVSVTTSTVLSQSGVAVLSFRDVTAQRVLESELRKTKEFLERLIDSTVDAIVAADLHGSIIIFNQGAERIFGYTAEEVIDRMPVWDLYAPDVPQDVMRNLRSTQHGGVGRIEQMRCDVINKHGKTVPVNMTASIIYEEGCEVATVGIFSDLRDRIRIEQRLLHAQKKLEITKEQAVLAELAGAAAHGLNQPLQSIIGYTELILRQSEPDASHCRAVDIILREAERMAEIVRNIGKITKYETKEYVPGVNIVDLDKSSKSGSDRAIVFPPSDAALQQELDDELDDELGDEITRVAGDPQVQGETIAQVELDEVLPPLEEPPGGPPGAVDREPSPSASPADSASHDAPESGAKGEPKGEMAHAGRPQ